MRSISSLIRSTHLQSIKIMRGPKKKKQAQLKIQSNDIVNIFKQRQDPQLKQLYQYPLYVQQLSRNKLTYFDFINAAQLQLPHQTPININHKTFLRGIKKQKKKFIRQYKQLDSIPIDKSQKYDYHKRSFIQYMFSKSQQQQQADAKARAAEEEEQDDDE